MLLALVLFPLIGIFLLFFAPEKRNAYALSVWFSLVHLVLSCILWWNFDASQLGYQFLERYSWLGELAIHFGVDGVSILFVPLSSLLVFLCVIVSPVHHSKPYWCFLLLSEFALMGTFLSVNLISFYIFFESALIPLFFMIAMWGGENRYYACLKFFVYTFAGSALMMIGLIIVWYHTGLDNFGDLLEMKSHLPDKLQNLLWWFFVLALAVKIPMLPVHTWLPHAHVEAPMAGSVLLAGIMLKMGGYGMLRLVLPLTPDACVVNAPSVMWLSAITIIYASWVAYGQKDIKKLVAYSSVAHMGYVTLAIFTLTPLGIEAAIIQMISHGIISAGLFFVVGFLYERTHSRAMDDYRGLVKTMPVLSLAMMVLTLGSIGLPGTLGFWGEFLALLAAFKLNFYVTVLAALGMIVGAVYMLNLYRVCFWGGVQDSQANLASLSVKEKFVLATLCSCILVWGMCPKLLTQTISQAPQSILRSYVR